ncbi:BrnA antitoxin family protein [Polaromonas sp.]|uniref:BrnA antitoxin family protein n=1 Tax=Polaromonas sp. TaxID=1869339 RepID=UPI0035642C97
MPKLKNRNHSPHPCRGRRHHGPALADPDAIPFTDAEWLEVKPLVRRSRPLGSGSKTQVTLRPDVEVVEKFRASGDGWQTRINAALNSWVRMHA